MLPSGEKARLAPESIDPPEKGRDRPVATFHSLTVLSAEADARILPSGEKATAQTGWVCPLSVFKTVVSPIRIR